MLLNDSKDLMDKCNLEKIRKNKNNKQNVKEYQNWCRIEKKLKNRKLKKMNFGCKIRCCNKKNIKL